MVLSPEIVSGLTGLANAADENLAWPEKSWDCLRQAGVPAWGVPADFGGRGMAGAELLAGYESLAAACLTTCFILSQRDAAVRRIRDHGTEELCRDLLPDLAAGKRFATVGLSHLTTSRQHGQPAMRVRETAGGYVLDGAMPWVTGAERADHLITGGVQDDGRQLLFALPRTLPGVEVGPPLPLMALAGSVTAEVCCHEVTVDRRWLLAGPAERVLATPGRSGTGGLETSCLALGLARAAVDYLRQESASRPDLRANTDRLANPRQALWDDLARLSATGPTPEQANHLRARANALVLRATQSALTAAKGTGFLRDHPAQRWARQAMFFLVWSCPRPAAEATLAFLNPPEAECFL